MNKKAIGVAVAVVLGGAVVGGSIYANQRLEEFYQGAFKDKRVGLKTSQFEMGIISGTAKWTLDLQPDLCSDNRLTLQGEDQISRSLDGHRIQSKVYMQSNDGNKFHLFNVDSKMSWTGSLHSDWVMPANQFVKNGIQTKWSDIHLKMQLTPESDGQFTIERMALDVPSVESASDKGGLMSVKNVRYESDMIGFKAGSDKASIEEIRFNNEQGGIQFLLQNWVGKGKQTISGDKFSSEHTSEITKIAVDNYQFEQIRLHGKVGDVDKSAFEMMRNLFKLQGERCITSKEVEPMVKDGMMQALKAGFSIESKGNQILLNQQAIRADLQATMPANPELTTQTETNQLINSIKYQANMSIDKGFVDNVMRLFASKTGRSISDEEIEMMVMQLVQSTKGRLEGDKILIEKHNP